MPVTVNVGGSRKVSHDYNSRGFSLNIQAELPASVIEDPNAMAESVNHLFQLADDLLGEQVRNATDTNGATSRPPTGLRRPSGNGSTPRRVPVEGAENGGNGNGDRRTPAPQNSANQSANDGNGNSQRPITAAQAKAIRNMTRRLAQDADGWAQDQFNVDGVADLSIRQASNLIDRLRQEIESQRGEVPTR